MKECSRCKQKKWNAEFSTSKRAKDRFRSECRECHVVEQQKYYQENKDECLEKSWIRALWRKFKLTPEAYYLLLEKQGGLCSICLKPPTKKRRLAVDHDRKCCSGENSCGKCVRGLLHQHCNSFVGWYETNKDNLISYLK